MLERHKLACSNSKEQCANKLRNSDTGEHISNEKNELEYVPFSICNETGKPLELNYGIEEGMLGNAPKLKDY